MTSFDGHETKRAVIDGSGNPFHQTPEELTIFDNDYHTNYYHHTTSQ
jgi:hypothetical protein